MAAIRNRRINDWQRSPLQRFADEARALWNDLNRTVRNDVNLKRDAHRAAWLMVILVAAVVLPMRVVEIFGGAL